jgi:hypothetical protein
LVSISFPFSMMSYLILWLFYLMIDSNWLQLFTELCFSIVKSLLLREDTWDSSSMFFCWRFWTNVLWLVFASKRSTFSLWSSIPWVCYPGRENYECLIMPCPPPDEKWLFPLWLSTLSIWCNTLRPFLSAYLSLWISS